MPGPQDRVLIELDTVAHLAGVDKAKASLLGLGVSTIALAAVLYGVIEIGKAALENFKAQEDAYSSLSQAVGVYNANVGKAAPATDKQAEAVKRSTEELANAKRALAEFDAGHRGHAATVTGGLKQIDTMHRQDIEHQIASAKTTKAKESAERRLAEFDVSHAKVSHAATGLSNAQAMRREDLVNRLAKAQRNATTAQRDATHAVQKDTINLEDLNKKTDKFIDTNKRYIDNQYDAKTAVGTFVRAGNNEKDALRLLGDSVDLAAVKHENLSSAAETLILAENGNSKGLRDLGITTAEVSSIMNSHLTTEQKHAHLLDLIESKTAHGRDTVGQLQQKQNTLNKDWQDFTARLGPGVETVLGGIASAADWATQQASGLDQALVAVGQDNAGWGNLQNWILGMIDPSGRLRLQASIANGTVFNPTSSRADPSHNRSERTGKVTIIVNGAADPNRTAKVIAKHLRDQGLV